jgi:hypothetical protein
LPETVSLDEIRHRFYHLERERQLQFIRDKISGVLNLHGLKPAMATSFTALKLKYDSPGTPKLCILSLESSM